MKYLDLDLNIKFILLILIFIGIILKLNIFIIIILIILTLLYYNYDTYLFDNSFKNDNIILLCTNPEEGHLGDHIYNTYYFNYIKDYIEKNNIYIYYYIDKIYQEEVKLYTISKNIIIKDFENRGLHLHVGGINKHNSYLKYFYDYTILKFKKIPYDKMYISYFNEISDKLNIPIKFEKFINIDNSFLIDYDMLDEKYKNIDILIINSLPRGGQFKVNISTWNKFINLLSNHFKIVTTLKVDNILCTWDDKLSVKKIGAISTHSKIIISINTGPTSCIFNSNTLNYAKKIYIFDNTVEFITYPSIENVNFIDEIKIDELKEIISSYK